MNIVLMADIHANYPAFRGVLKNAMSFSPDAILIAGDICGYYPDVNEVIDEIFSINIPIYCVAGNHDMPIINKNIPDSLPYSHILVHNLNNITDENLQRLSVLPAYSVFCIDKLKFYLTHGTPTDNLNGRLYPDNKPDLSWFNNETDIFVLGHTHYPAIWSCYNNKIIINPGSVGQPRDGHPFPSWALINTSTRSLIFVRTDYDRERYYNHLLMLGWDKRALSALSKQTRGSINLWD